MSHIVVTHTMPNTAPEAVWSAITQLGGLSAWNRSVKDVVVLSNQECGVGARARLRMEDGSELLQENTAYDPKAFRHAFDVDGIPAPFASMAGEMTVRPDGDGCTISFESEYSLKGGVFGAAIDKLLLRSLMRREHGKMLVDLEHHLNTGERIGKDGVRLPAEAAA